MPFEQRSALPRRIAVIGGGISGLGAAQMLSDTHLVTLFEAAPRLGGHARTVMAGKRGDQPVDMGFIVFNQVNYPRLTTLFDQLDVPVAPSNMSFGVSIDGGALEYALSGINALFAQRARAGDPRFLRMIRDIFRFNAGAEAAITGPDMTVRDLLASLGTGPWFRDYYLLPFSGAIWSMPKRQVLDFPAMAMIRFFRNHHLLSHRGQHQWYTVRGGSVQYVSRLESTLRRRGVEIRTGCPVRAIRRDGLGVTITPAGGEAEHFDDVVLATHSDDSLSLLADASPFERAALARIRYQPNQVTLHADPAMMPRRRRVWSSWVYSEDRRAPSDVIDLTYWMNSLQPIPDDDPLFVTLNSRRPIRDELIHDQVTMRHPVYDADALVAQEEIRARNGTFNTWFCGAWMKNGFHEDGLASAADVVSAMAARPLHQVAAE
ncbi:NAD(P)/FAD-dependent oxidoreductase [Marinibacterium sp. SX1]|uniref:NAD(P)/FAD-dependent oxidoreductase n=1 Tax=Marinibacterium sp. SX1 TaxID=3388424 RepID=UPI003D16F90A